MIGKIWNYFSPTDASSQNSSSNNNFVDSSLSLQGTLYIREPDQKIKQLSEECSISLEIKDESIYNYVLNIENDDKSKWDKMQFVINVDSQFKTFLNSLGNKCIMWQKGMTFYILELFSDESILQNEPIFYEKLSVLLVSNDFQIPISKAIKEETKSEYILNYDQIEKLDDFLEENFKRLKVQKAEKQLEEKMNDLKISNINKKDFAKKYQIYKEIFSSEGTSFKFNIDDGGLDPLDEGESFLKVIDTGNFEYLLVLQSKEFIFVYTKIDPQSCITVNDNLGCISFITGSSAYSFGFKDKDKDVKTFQSLLLKCLYEFSAKVDFENFSQQAKDFIDFENNYREEEDEENNTLNKTINFDENYHEMNNTINDDNAKNKLITQAYAYDKTFLIKDDNTIDVFNTDKGGNKLIDDNKLDPFNTEKYIKKNISISGVKMYSGDNQMLFQDSNNKDSIWQYDLNKESVIEEWKCGESGKPLLDLTHSSKYGQMSKQCDMIGINSSDIFALDGRVNRPNKVVNEKSYKSSPKFTCVATPGFEAIATGSENGDIRLYSEVGKNAKTLIPCFGDPIRALDATKDGKYILATCDKYIMLVNVVGEHNENGFTVCLKRAKRKPKTLKISPFDIVRYGLKDDSYTPARFNLSNTSSETTITTSLGPYIIIWNFEDVKKGILDSYKLKNVNEYVLANTSRFDRNQMIVAMPSKVRLQNEKFVESK